MHTKKEVYLRNFIFGVEDSIVSTVGLLSGVVIGGVSREVVILTGIVLIFVEAFSMGIGSFLSEYAAEEMVTQRAIPRKVWAVGGAIMFISYIVAGLIPLAPYLFLSFVFPAFLVSILLSLVVLFVLGMIGGAIGGISTLRRGLRMFTLGGFAILIGALAARFVALL